MIKITFPNQAQFFKQLRSVGPAVKKDLNVVNKETAEAMVFRAKILTHPKSQANASIRFNKERGGDGYIVQAGGPLTTNDKGFDHILEVEYGSKHTSARPFFWPAFRSVEGPFEMRMEDTVRRVIRNKGF